MASSIAFTVVGMRFLGLTPEQVLENPVLVLQPEPTNKYDKNAIMVMCRDGASQLGHVTREETSKVRQAAKKLQKPFPLSVLVLAHDKSEASVTISAEIL
nr:hypothetical protein [Sicyoidochytrium minutum DNA virus]